MVNKIVSGLIILLVLSTITLTTKVHANSDMKTWTVMVYMDADNNLDPAGVDDIHEMQAVGSTDNVNVVVLFDRWHKTSGLNGTVIFYIHQGYNETVWGGWSEEYEKNMGDPETLKWFVNYTVYKYPAEKYALILWDHGGNWEGACWDETNGWDCLTVEDIKEAIENSILDKIDLLGFDACNMASIEVAYTLTLTDKVGIMVASQEWIPWDGWPYDMILKELAANPAWNAREFSSSIVENYVVSYAGVPLLKIVATLSAINLTYVDDLVSLLSDLTDYILTDFNNLKMAVTGAKNEADRYWFGMWHQGPYIDVYQFIQKLGAQRKSLKQYTDHILELWDDLVIKSKCYSGPHMRGCNGLTIYFPRNRNLFCTPEPYYENIPEFAEKTKWYDLLTAYFS